MSYSPRETIGFAIARTGLYDFPLCELLLRLTDAGDHAVDVGANIGAITSLLAHAVGPAGRVVAFEPHPVVYRRLAQNVAVWPTRDRITLHRIALAQRDGTGYLGSDHFATNEGSAALHAEPAPYTCEVSIRRLDSLLAGRAIGVLKVDVEGHEGDVLAGAETLLREGAVRDIVFEERAPPPTMTMRLLERYGYTILQFEEQLLGLRLRPPSRRRQLLEAPSLLATLDPERAQCRVAPRGWEVFGLCYSRRSASADSRGTI